VVSIRGKSRFLKELISASTAALEPIETWQQHKWFGIEVSQVRPPQGGKMLVEGNVAGDGLA
jgi:hypothetical protein